MAKQLNNIARIDCIPTNLIATIKTCGENSIVSISSTDNGLSFAQAFVAPELVTKLPTVYTIYYIEGK